MALLCMGFCLPVHNAPAQAETGQPGWRNRPRGSQRRPAGDVLGDYCLMRPPRGQEVYYFSRKRECPPMSSGNSLTSSCPAFLSEPSSPREPNATHGICSGSSEAQPLAEPTFSLMESSAAHAEKVHIQHTVHSSLTAALLDAGRSPSYRLRKAALAHASLVTSR